MAVTRAVYYVTAAKVLEGFRLRVTFADQSEGVVDLSDVVARGGVFTPLKDPAFFSLARADTEAGTVVWPNELDVAPEELYARANGRAVKVGPHGPHRRSGARAVNRLGRSTRAAASVHDSHADSHGGNRQRT